MLSDLDDTRSDISSRVSAVTESSVAPCYGHATSHDARRAAEHRHRAFPAGRWTKRNETQLGALGGSFRTSWNRNRQTAGFAVSLPICASKTAANV